MRKKIILSFSIIVVSVMLVMGSFLNLIKRKHFELPPIDQGGGCVSINTTQLTTTYDDPVYPGDSISFNTLNISSNNSDRCYLRATIQIRFINEQGQQANLNWLEINQDAVIENWVWYYASKIADEYGNKTINNLLVLESNSSVSLKLEDYHIDSSLTEEDMLPGSTAQLKIIIEAIQVDGVTSSIIFSSENWQ